MRRAIAAVIGCALLGCQEPAAKPADAAATQPSGATAAPSSVAASRAPKPAAGATNCIDAWLEARKLNEFGDPPGTMYAGGTPLFDEKTGKQRDRLELVQSKHPAAAQACAKGKDAG